MSNGVGGCYFYFHEEKGNWETSKYVSFVALALSLIYIANIAACHTSNMQVTLSLKFRMVKKADLNRSIKASALYAQLLLFFIMINIFIAEGIFKRSFTKPTIPA